MNIWTGGNWRGRLCIPLFKSATLDMLPFSFVFRTTETRPWFRKRNRLIVRNRISNIVISFKRSLEFPFSITYSYFCSIRSESIFSYNIFLYFYVSQSLSMSRSVDMTCGGKRHTCAPFLNVESAWVIRQPYHRFVIVVRWFVYVTATRWWKFTIRSGHVWKLR